MNLNKIKKDIDALLEEYKDKWMNDHTFDKIETAIAFKEWQIYTAMYLLSYFNTSHIDLKDPIVSTKLIPEDLQGETLIFTWEFDDNFYKKLKLIVPEEGDIYIETTNNEETYYSKTQKLQGYEIGNASE